MKKRNRQHKSNPLWLLYLDIVDPIEMAKVFSEVNNAQLVGRDIAELKRKLEEKYGKREW